MYVDKMANLTIESKYEMKSGYEIPVLGYGASAAMETHGKMITNVITGLANVISDQLKFIEVLLTENKATRRLRSCREGIL